MILSVIILALSLLFLFLGDLEVFFVSLFVSIAIGASPIITWQAHANDLSNIKNQHLNMIEYQKHVSSLQDRLNSFDYPKGSLVNVDTPVAAIVNSLSDAESKLLKAKVSRIESIKDVDARKLGVMSGVVSFVGDYNEEVN
jgi:hypothetical protein